MQELREAAALSKDKAMLSTFLQEKQNPKLINPNTGEEYENPYTCLHVKAACSIYPELNDVEPWKLIKESKRVLPDGTIRRQNGKILNFG